MLEIASLEQDKYDNGKDILLLNIQAPFPGAFFIAKEAIMVFKQPLR